jgi:hypothetical protein
VYEDRELVELLFGLPSTSEERVDHQVDITNNRHEVTAKTIICFEEAKQN